MLGRRSSKNSTQRKAMNIRIIDNISTSRCVSHIILKVIIKRLLFSRAKTSEISLKSYKK